jgi:aspartyl-tRNA(Asn)/glutamyl-tRNA(Gln) amidotransferase subunit A
VSAVDRSLEAIRSLDGDLRACILVRRDEALAEEREHWDPAGPLRGWTIGVKDNMDVAGTVRTDGLRPPHGPPAAADSEAVRRLRAAGAVVVAKTNVEELSFGATTQNAWWGRCRNPWDRERIPGGSSGGSAVAVAAGLVTAALGTDTGGSLRNPAALCGVSALRTTWGLIPFDGVTSLSPDFDVVGPIARSAAELGLVLDALVPDGRLAGPPATLAGARIGIPSEFFYEDLHPDVAAGADAVVAELTAAGAALHAVRLDGAAAARDALAVLLNAQAADLHPHWLEDDRVAPMIRDRIALGRDASERDREAAAAVATSWRAAVGRCLEDVDALLVPTTPMPAPPIDDEHMVAVSKRVNRLNAPWSLAGLPALTVPAPMGPAGLPVGVQLVGPPLADRRLVELAQALQLRIDWHSKRPPAAAA